MRLFVAVHFSPEIKTVLLSAIDDLRRQSAGNFTRPENLHLTLAFIGEMDRVAEAEAAFSAVTAAPFELIQSEVVLSNVLNKPARVSGRFFIKAKIIKQQIGICCIINSAVMGHERYRDHSKGD